MKFLKSLLILTLFSASSLVYGQSAVFHNNTNDDVEVTLTDINGDTETFTVLAMDHVNHGFSNITDVLQTVDVTIISSGCSSQVGVVFGYPVGTTTITQGSCSLGDCTVIRAGLLPTNVYQIQQF